VEQHLNKYEHGDNVPGIAVLSVEVGPDTQHFVHVDSTIGKDITEKVHKLEGSLIMPQQFY
jgi:hypothetical protein